MDGIEYVGGTLEMIAHEEGRITKSGSTYTYQYFLRDHLGNNRVGFAQGTSVTVPNFSTDYYPFGLAYRQYIRVGSPKNNYLYKGRELQDSLRLYDYGARLYDPVVGRWNAVDPLAEKYKSISPYVYVANNPLLFVDPDGRDILIFYYVKNIKGGWSEHSFRFTGNNASQAPQHLFVDKVIQAYEYNISNGGGKNMLKAATTKIDVELRSGIDDLHRAGKVQWNPFLAHEYEEMILSPATALEHETAVGNGETTSGKSRRSHDGGRSIRVSNPNSIIENDFPSWLMLDGRFPNNDLRNFNTPFHE